MNFKSKLFTGLGALAAVICLGTSILGAAAWRAEGRTINNVTLATVTGKIEEVYEQNTEVYPGGAVNKRVEVENTGSADAIARVKTEAVWGDMIGGVFVQDPALSAENIVIEYNKKDWILIGDFYYYKKVLAPGERSTPLMESFVLTGETGNAYAGKTGNVIVSMEIIQAGGGAESFWGITYEDLEIEYVPNTQPPVTGEVLFSGKAAGFSFDKNMGDLFVNFKNMIPGEAVSQLVTVTNREAEEVMISLWAEQDDQAKVPEKQAALASQLLGRYSQLTVTDDSGDIIYSGPVWDADNALRVSLGNFAPGETKNLNLSLQISPEVGNDFRKLAASVIWGFEAMGKETPVPTGDTTNFLPYILLAAGSAVMFAVFTVMNFRRKSVKPKGVTR